MAAGVTWPRAGRVGRGPSVRTVFFDFGYTLATLAVPVPEIWSTVLRDRGHDVAPDVFKSILREADAHLTPRLYDSRGRMREFWKLYDKFVLDRLRIPDEDGVFAASIDAAFQDTHRWFRVYPDVRDALSSLRSLGLNVGVISNNTDDLIQTLADLDLARYFDHVTYSQEARAEKPQPAVFQLALQRAGCRPEEAVHVGDKFDHDVVGARGVGIEPILIDREDRWPGADCTRVRNLTEVVTLLKERNL